MTIRIFILILCLQSFVSISHARKIRGTPFCLFQPSNKKLFCQYSKDFSHFAKLARQNTGPTDVLILEIYGGKLDRIEPSMFQSYTSLKELYLVDLEMTQEFPRNAFNGLFKLEKLQVIHQNFTSVNYRTIKEIRNLKVLDLSYNPISDCDFHKQRALTTLHELVASHTKISVLTTPCFDGLTSLKILRLEFNKIKTFLADFLTKMPKLEELYLRGNLFTTFKIATIKAPTITLIDLDGNRFTDFGELDFKGVPNLHYLSLAYTCCSCVKSECCATRVCSKPTELKASAFMGLKKLSVLDMRAMRMSEIPENLLEGTPSLQFLQMSNLTFEGSAIQKHKLRMKTIKHLALIGLYLHYNQFFCDCDMFWLWISLKHPGTLFARNLDGVNVATREEIETIRCLTRRSITQDTKAQICGLGMCRNSDHPCRAPYAECVELPNDSFNCTCKKGFSGDGRQFCDADGVWLSWTRWTLCDADCNSLGSIRRWRDCQMAGPYSKDCPGDQNQTQVCRGKPCPVDGVWASWQSWSHCSSPCGNGTKHRMRYCDNPSPKHLGKFCPGQNFQNVSCNLRPCPVDGKWTSWTMWSQCSFTCGPGRKKRRRLCSAPEPAHGGEVCPEADTDIDFCFEKPCPIDGNWHHWQSWSHCSASCDGGKKTRTRHCVDPKPMYGGKKCIGKSSDESGCNSQPCPIDGKWSSWGQWSECSAKCNPGRKVSRRACDNPVPQYGGWSCPGVEQRYAQCFVEVCPGFNCVTKNMGWECNCKPGHRANGEQCEDIDECKAPEVDRVCPILSTCKNLPGSYTCVCVQGFKKEAKSELCLDIDECTEGASCPSNMNCINTFGSYRCKCQEGYKRVGDECLDIDECKVKYQCGTLGSCINTIGSYNCFCKPGTKSKNGLCIDINECKLGIDRCHRSASCLNTEGSYKCKCKTGFTGNGIKCRVMDACDRKGLDCHELAECKTIAGTTMCLCKEGHSGDGMYYCSKTKDADSFVATLGKRADVALRVFGDSAEYYFGGSSIVFIILFVAATVITILIVLLRKCVQLMYHKYPKTQVIPTVDFAPMKKSIGKAFSCLKKKKNPTKK